MYINAIAHYLPERIIPNEYFLDVNGLSDDFITQRTGIKTRAKASESENTNSLAVTAVHRLAESCKEELNDVDLIIGATYSPFDTVGTLAHAVQRALQIDKARVVSISSACSSFVNAFEIVEGYFVLGKAHKAIVVAAEHNSYYNDESNVYSGHLWGDGAVAVLVSSVKGPGDDLEVVDIMSSGLANVDKGLEGVYLRPKAGGIQMPDGKNVFLNACKFMTSNAQEILAKNGYSQSDIDFFIAHQANKRIIDNVAGQLGLSDEKVLTNIEQCGNTGCASCGIVLSQNYSLYKQNNIIVISVFGGGYSSGSMLLRK